MSNHPNLSPVVDFLSVGAIAGAVAHILPPLAAVIAVVWYVLEIYESQTIQGILHRHKVIKRLKRRHVSRVKRRTYGSPLSPSHKKNPASRS